MILAASGIILQNQKILLLQRSNYTKNYPEFWGCPGVKEECNLDFKPTKILKTGVWQQRKYYRFLGNWTGEIKIQELEVLDYNWFTYHEAMKLNLSFDYKEVLDILHKKQLL